MPPVKLNILEEEMREDAQIFQAYVEKPLLKAKKEEEIRTAEEARVKAAEEVQMMNEIQKISECKDIEEYMTNNRPLFDNDARMGTGGGVSKRLTLLKKLAAKAQK